MTEVVDLVALIQKLSQVGLVTLLFLAGFASYKGWWVWGRQFLDMKTQLEQQLADLKADYEKRLLKYEASNQMWQDMALKATGLAENSVVLAKGNGK